MSDDTSKMGLPNTPIPNPPAKENPNLYEDDMTDERGPTPAQRDDVARTQVQDPDVLDNG